MYREEIVRILYKIANKQEVTIEEGKLLDEWLEESPHNRELLEEVSDLEAMKAEVKEMITYDSRQLWKKVRQRIPRKENRVVAFFRSPSLKYAAAALVLILLSAVLYIYYIKPGQQTETIAQPGPVARPDIQPGIERAILTLDDGTTLVLDSTANGRIAQEGETSIVKAGDVLAYKAGKDATGKLYYNTITTPRGGFYPSLVLADGSKVWLDALSSIRFPVSFTGNERVVTVTGQAYFEVAKDVARPFKVQVKDKALAVEVLGTQFNINAYDDEAAVNTTLLEGAVKIIAGSEKNVALLKPGQQASSTGGKIMINPAVDTEEVMAWKNGQFLFKRADMQTIMRQVERWYGVEVVFADNIEGTFVVNPLPRNVPVSRLLTYLSAMNEMKFEINEKEKRITIRK